MHTLETFSLELNMVPGVLLEPYMSQGDQGVAETPIVSKGLNLPKEAVSNIKPCNYIQ